MRRGRKDEHFQSASTSITKLICRFLNIQQKKSNPARMSWNEAASD